MVSKLFDGDFKIMKPIILSFILAVFLSSNVLAADIFEKYKNLKLEDGFELVKKTCVDFPKGYKRSVTLDTGKFFISVDQGCRLIFAYPGTAPFANVNVETSEGDNYAKDRKIAEDMIRYAAKADNGYFYKRQYKGIDFFVTRKKSLQGKVLSIGVIPIESEKIIITAYLVKQDPKHRAFNTYEEFVKLSDRFFINFINALNNTKRTELQKVADKTAAGGWEAFRAGRLDDARYRFGQALLFDKSNGLALWGIAVIHAQKGEYGESLKAFQRAEATMSNDVDFNVDFSRTLGYAGVRARSEKMVRSAFERYRKIYEKWPQHALNLQNWAIILFYTGNYALAWEKIKLAEATPDAKYLDQKFIAALQSKMARP
jgi:tetratricopeptide (TPR) repeat protein